MSRRADTSVAPLSASAAPRVLHTAAALLAGSVLADSGVQHYRGSLRNPAMYGALTAAALGLAAGVTGVAAQSNGTLLRRLYRASAAVGLIGAGFHIYDLAKRRPDSSWNDLFYETPGGTPAVLALAGLLGLAAVRLDEVPAGETPRFFGMPAGRTLAALVSAGLAELAREAGLMHFRGSVQNPSIYLTLSLPPVAALLMADAAIGPARPDPWFKRVWLTATAALGVAGTAFQAKGVSSAMGAWRNCRQTVIDGPPVPVPLSFSALALAGLAALSLMRKRE